MIEREFSPKTRTDSISRLRAEKFDILVVGGGITGAAVARDAVSRGLKVALVEKNDFAHGTSSRSSKLIHGGLRYLQNLEFRLVFEALAERFHLMSTAPHLVRPISFYFPIYEGDPVGRTELGLGMWLYDALSLFRAPKLHRNFNAKQARRLLPELNQKDLKGVFEYPDATMWDDALVLEVLRDASARGAACVNYVEALTPIREGKDRIAGFRVQDLYSKAEWEIRASRTVLCTGPWLDGLGPELSSKWVRHLKPSKVAQSSRNPVEIWSQCAAKLSVAREESHLPVNKKLLVQDVVLPWVTALRGVS